MLLQRMMRAARLDPALYYEVMRDRSANGQAFAVVLIVVACLFAGYGVLNPMAYILKVVCLGGGVLFWAMVSMLIGQRYGGRAEFDEVFRPVAFAHTPGVLYALTLVPGWGLGLAVAAWIWTAAALFVAIREALHLPGRQAALTVLFTFLIIFAIDRVTGMTFGTLDSLLLRLGL